MPWNEFAGVNARCWGTRTLGTGRVVRTEHKRGPLISDSSVHLSI